MIKQFIKISVFCFVLLGLLNSCKRTDAVGPDLFLAGNDFQLLSGIDPNVPIVDFSTGKAFFTAVMNGKYQWTIEITGDDSGAKKTISGISEEIDSTNSCWDGNSDDAPFFRSEDCTVKLIIPKSQGESLEFTTVIRVGIVKPYNNILLLNDFEVSPPNPWWTALGAYDIAKFQPTLSYSVDGQVSMLYEAQRSDGSSWYGVVGAQMKDINSHNGYGVSDYLFLPTTDPDSIYFNVYIYGRGQDEVLDIALQEDEDLSGGHDGLTEDSWVYSVKVDWEGWKLCSVKYSDIPISTDGCCGANGNKIPEPDKAVSMIMILWAPNKQAGGHAQVYFDFLNLSFGGPFVP